MEEHVVLGCTWCYLTNCQIDWHEQQAKMVYKGHATQIPFLQEGTSMQPSTQSSGVSTTKKGKVKTAIPQEIPSTNTSQPLNSTPTSLSTQPHIPQPHPWPTPCSRNPITTSSVTRWIPKKLLDAQGYFKGKRNVWLPREPQHQRPTSSLQSKPHQSQISRSNDNIWFPSSICSQDLLLGNSLMNVSTHIINGCAIFTSILHVRSGTPSYILIECFNVEVKYLWEQYLSALGSVG